MVLDNDEVQGKGKGTWGPMDDALVKGKAHQAKESEYDLFMAH